MAKHRWNMGWPGNFCINCGAADLLEVALADNRYDPITDTYDTPEYEAQIKAAFNNCPVEEESTEHVKEG